MQRVWGNLEIRSSAVGTFDPPKEKGPAIAGGALSCSVDRCDQNLKRTTPP